MYSNGLDTHRHALICLHTPTLRIRKLVFNTHFLSKSQKSKEHVELQDTCKSFRFQPNIANRPKLRQQSIVGFVCRTYTYIYIQLWCSCLFSDQVAYWHCCRSRGNVRWGCCSGEAIAEPLQGMQSPKYTFYYGKWAFYRRQFNHHLIKYPLSLYIYTYIYTYTHI